MTTKTEDTSKDFQNLAEMRRNHLTYSKKETNYSLQEEGPSITLATTKSKFRVYQKYLNFTILMASLFSIWALCGCREFWFKLNHCIAKRGQIENSWARHAFSLRGGWSATGTGTQKPKCSEQTLWRLTPEKRSQFERGIFQHKTNKEQKRTTLTIESQTLSLTTR